MKVLIRNSDFNDFFYQDISQLLVYNEDNQLLAAMWKREDGTIALSKAGDEDFDLICSELGLNKDLKLKKIVIKT